MPIAKDFVYSDPTQQLLRELFIYNPGNGEFQFRPGIGGNRIKKVLGCERSNGRVVINVAGRPHTANRLAWIYVHGDIPAMMEVKTKLPLNPANPALSGNYANRIDNLELCTREEFIRDTGQRIQAAAKRAGKKMGRKVKDERPQFSEKDKPRMMTFDELLRQARASTW